MDRQAQILRLLESRKLRSTVGRRAIAREILSLGARHFSAEELVARLRRRGNAVSRATIYRTLEHLASGGFLRRLSLGQRHALYECDLERPHHEHLICVRCGSLTEFDSTALDRVLLRLCGGRCFRLQRHAIQIFGTCSKCAGGEPS